jgi:hypothetical protein
LIRTNRPIIDTIRQFRKGKGGKFSQQRFEKKKTARHQAAGGGALEQKRTPKQVFPPAPQKNHPERIQGEKQAEAEQDDFKAAPGRLQVKPVSPGGLCGDGKERTEVKPGIRSKKDQAGKARPQETERTKDFKGLRLFRHGGNSSGLLLLLEIAVQNHISGSSSKSDASSPAVPWAAASDWRNGPWENRPRPHSCRFSPRFELSVRVKIPVQAAGPFI